MAINAPEGTRDLLPDEALFWNQFKPVSYTHLSYNLVDGPIARDASVRPWYHDAMLKRPSSGKKAL